MGAFFYRQMSIGAQLISEERWRQQAKENYTAEHDDSHDQQELAWAASAYVTAYLGKDVGELWPWEADSFKVGDSPIGELVKAGALIAAEIDRRFRQDGIQLPGEAPSCNSLRMKDTLTRIAQATRIDAANPTFMGWSDMKVEARKTLDSLDDG